MNKYKTQLQVSIAPPKSKLSFRRFATQVILTTEFQASAHNYIITLKFKSQQIKAHQKKLL